MPWFAFFFLRARLLLPVFAMTLSLAGGPLRVLSEYYGRASFYGSPPRRRGAARMMRHTCLRVIPLTCE